MCEESNVYEGFDVGLCSLIWRMVWVIKGGVVM